MMIHNLASVSVSYYCDKLPHNLWLKMIQIYYLTVLGGQKSKMGLTGLKSRFRQVCVPSGGSRGKTGSLPLPVSRSCLHPWQVLLSSTFRVHHSNLCFCFHISQTRLSSSLTYKDPCDHIGPPG